MKFQSLIFLVVPLLFFGMIRDILAKGNPSKHHLTIVYTNDVQGEIEPCG